MTFGPALTPTANGNMDSSGTRANFDYTDPITLSAGSYTLSSFQFEASQSGDAVPVLATVSGGAAGSGSETYSIIATGSDTSVNAAGLYSTAENDIFTIPAGGETVYAGFVNETAQPVDWAFVGPNTDAHFNPGQDLLTGNNPAEVGDQFAESGGGGGSSATSTAAYELNREYQFNISVTPIVVPEPASIVLLCGGVVALGAFRRGRRRLAI